jgi:hypothetical protein
VRCLLVKFVLFCLVFSTQVYSKVEYSTCADLASTFLVKTFKNPQKDFNRELGKNFSKTEVDNIKDNLNSLLFIDYQNSFNSLLKIFNGKLKVSKTKIWNIFDTTKKKAFANYVKSSNYLIKNKPSINMNTMKTLHRKMMEGEIDDLAEVKLGKIRDVDVIGFVYKEDTLTPEIYKTIKENPYLGVENLKKDGKVYVGAYEYPGITNLTPEVQNIIKKIDKDLYIEVEKYLDDGVGKQKDLTTKIVNALSENLLDWYTLQRSQLGDINDPLKLKKFIRLVAEFNRNMVSVHPFQDGNGRTLRELTLYYPFIQEGFPPPRITNTYDDLFLSLDEWAIQVEKGLENSQSMYEALTKRLVNGQSLDITPELLFPNIPKRASINKLTQKPRKLIKDSRFVDIDTAQFAIWVKHILADDKVRASAYKNSPYIELKKIGEEYGEFVKGSRLDFIHPKFGEENVGLYFIDQDFFVAFNDNSFRSAAKWQKKIAQYYPENVTMWRGLSYPDKVIDEKEIVKMFSTVHEQFVSNKTLGKVTNSTTEKQLMKMALTDFDRYNYHLSNGGLVEMAMDHHRQGKLYWDSYGISFTEKRSIGKAYAMGAGAYVPLGQQMGAKLNLSSRILIGVKKGLKDVKLSRLKQIRSDFSYKYPRQKEIMGIGAADPDSVMIVQSLDEDGKVLLTFVRNPEKPNEIRVYDYEVSDYDKLADDQIKTIKLK